MDLRQEHKKVDVFGRIARDYLIENFDAMHDGAVVSNRFDFNSAPLEDGEAEHLSALQKCFDFIADDGMEAFQIEHQNDPPAIERNLMVHVSADRVMECVGDMKRMQVACHPRVTRTGWLRNVTRPVEFSRNCGRTADSRSDFAATA